LLSSGQAIIFKKNNVFGFSKEKTKPAVTLDDITPELRAELEQQFYQQFEFSKLYQPNLEPSPLLALVPWIQLGLLLLTLIFVIRN